MNQSSAELGYYFELLPNLLHRYEYEINLNLGILNYIAETACKFGQEEIGDKSKEAFEKNLKCYFTQIYQNFEP